MFYGNYPDLTKVKRVLVVKMRHHGDVLLTSSVFSNLKKRLPSAEIDVFLYKDTLPMLEGHPDISGFILYDRSWKKLSFFSKLAKELSLLRKIRKGSYDLVLNLTEGDRGAIAAFVSGAPIRVGFDPQGKGFKGKKKVYTHVLKSCSTPRHTVERQLDVLRRIGIFPTADERDLTFAIPEAAKNKMKEKVKEGEYILIHPVSRWRFKCPPPTLIAEWIAALHSQGHSVVLTSGPDAQEIAMIDDILKQVPRVPVTNLAGKTSLKELGALIQMSRCLICVDSVPLHMASALKSPVVAVFGPSSEQNWGPWRNPKGIVVAQPFSCRPCHLDGCGGSKKSDCLYTLPTQSVLDAVNTLLN